MDGHTCSRCSLHPYFVNLKLVNGSPRHFKIGLAFSILGTKSAKTPQLWETLDPERYISALQRAASSSLADETMESSHETPYYNVANTSQKSNKRKSGGGDEGSGDGAQPRAKRNRYISIAWFAIFSLLHSAKAIANISII